MCEVNENKLNEEEGYIESEEQMGLISVQEELKRIDIQENPVSKASKETKNSNFYKESIIIAETVGEVFQKLLGYGVDYSNALALSSNLVTNDVTLKQQKIVQATQEQNQV
jgi:hypothetical protein